MNYNYLLNQPIKTDNRKNIIDIILNLFCCSNSGSDTPNNS